MLRPMTYDVELPVWRVLEIDTHVDNLWRTKPANNEIQWRTRGDDRDVRTAVIAVEIAL